MSSVTSAFAVYYSGMASLNVGYPAGDDIYSLQRLFPAPYIRYRTVSDIPTGAVAAARNRQHPVNDNRVEDDTAREARA
jgi:hypothetical protein